jgi:lipoate-protein ligase A
MNDEERKYFEQFHRRLTNLEQNGIPGVRDFFATSALSYLSNQDIHFYELTPSEIAARSYELADAMIEEREKNAVAK